MTAEASPARLAAALPCPRDDPANSQAQPSSYGAGGLTPPPVVLSPLAARRALRAAPCAPLYAPPKARTRHAFVNCRVNRAPRTLVAPRGAAPLIHRSITRTAPRRSSSSCETLASRPI